ncbi:hypothetical protein UYO_1992 [Lachnospiraceae bacterium JC7]|nr:hypothetical protein UYO_1992 [Lachnospiraceae bacterium JC7]
MINEKKINEYNKMAGNDTNPGIDAGESLMENYIRNARKFTVIGLVGVLVGIMCILIIREQNNPLMVLAAIVMFAGALIAVTGISSLRAEGMLRTFAQIATMQPTTASMNDLKLAIARCGMAGVRKQVKFQIEAAVSKYEKLEGADLELAEDIRKSGQNLHVKRII